MTWTRPIEWEVRGIMLIGNRPQDCTLGVGRGRTSDEAIADWQRRRPEMHEASAVYAVPAPMFRTTRCLAILIFAVVFSPVDSDSGSLGSYIAAARWTSGQGSDASDHRAPFLPTAESAVPSGTRDPHSRLNSHHAVADRLCAMPANRRANNDGGRWASNLRT